MGRDRALALPHVKALCPLTDVLFGTKRVEQHYCRATLCANGAVHIYCVLHMFKGFISHPQILEAWHVTESGKTTLPVRPGV